MRRRVYCEYICRVCFWGAGFFVVGILAIILGLLIYRGGGALSWEFLTSEPKGLFLGTAGGIFPAILGTFSLLAIATVAAAFPALLVSIYIVEYGNGAWFAKFCNYVVQSMVGIPSILIGLFGYSCFVVYLGFGISLLAGGLTLSVMIFPTVTVLMRDALKAVNGEYRLIGEILGVSKGYILKKVILPEASPNLLSAVLLAMGYAAGATAPIMVTAAVILTRGGISLHNPVMALPFHLYILFSQHVSIERAYGTALVLVLMLLCINSLSQYLRYRYEKRVTHFD
ncbi:phosphate ABC transporter membrane protein 2, PhoT family [Sporomusa acidovorans]|nr:ABC transporter permease subunit [Sporomusa acidovorans]OZC20999.1 phosphate transport system permease protein PstA [Sporomusa acidovorans DSM 3132]SDF79623.1 phosphate ABC transporter membrane protein 2, PhoT family [Sporomusa acidovorans]